MFNKKKKGQEVDLVTQKNAKINNNNKTLPLLATNNNKSVSTPLDSNQKQLRHSFLLLVFHIFSFLSRCFINSWEENVDRTQI